MQYTVMYILIFFENASHMKIFQLTKFNKKKFSILLLSGKVKYIFGLLAKVTCRFLKVRCNTKTNKNVSNKKKSLTRKW